MKITKRTPEEIGNTLTHLAGVIFTLLSAWGLLILAYADSWQSAMGVTFFIVGMLCMYSFSTIYHWALSGRLKRMLRLMDHIGIYIMIACSYTPICISVVGGWIGWTVFALLWLTVLGGTIYKIAAIGRYPRISLLIYLLMGWSVVFIAQPVWESLSTTALLCLLSEGVFYTSGTYFYSHDSRPHFHAIWHVFVLLGSLSHWATVFCILKGI